MQWLLAGVAGLATVASPCVLPLLPLVLGVSVGQTDRSRPLFIVLGFVLSFSALALAFGASTRVLGLSPDAVRVGSAALLLIAGVIMLVPSWSDRLTMSLSGISGWGQRLGDRAGAGALGAMTLGAALGAVWTPCAGPALASILALIAGNRDHVEAGALLLAYATGAGIPMLLIAYGGQSIVRWVGPLSRRAGTLRRVFGAAVVATALAMLAQVDTQVTAWLSQFGPDLDVEGSQPSLRPRDGIAPTLRFESNDAWFNTPEPLSLDSLRGRVVLVDFWTHGCINCIRTLPHIQRLHELYASSGLVVVGVHTPEFAHERSAARLQAAIRHHGLTYPIAQDNQYKTWDNFRNRYWPAQYLIDRQGQLVFFHFGEGNEQALEAQVRRALAQSR